MTSWLTSEQITRTTFAPTTTTSITTTTTKFSLVIVLPSQLFVINVGNCIVYMLWLLLFLLLIHMYYLTCCLPKKDKTFNSKISCKVGQLGETFAECCCCFCFCFCSGVASKRQKKIVDLQVHLKNLSKFIVEICICFHIRQSNRVGEVCWSLEFKV